MEKWEPLCTVGGTEIGEASVRKGMEVPRKNKNRTTTGLSNPTSGYLSEVIQNMYWKRCIHPYVHRSIIYNSQDIKATEVFIYR